MKRDIYCTQCATEIREKYGIPTGSNVKITPYVGEGLRVVDGTALDHYNCDACNAIIIQGKPCAAVSFWLERSHMPYYEWEPEYIKVPTPLTH